jgi:hypothetical protein
MPTYVTVQQFRDFLLPRELTETDEELEPILELAEDDVDDAVGKFYPDITTGRKFDVTLMTQVPWQLTALRKAVCAQVEYRMLMGETFFIQGEQREVVGRRVEVHKPTRLGPKAQTWLTRGKLYRLSGISRGQGLPNQNVDDIIP